MVNPEKDFIKVSDPFILNGLAILTVKCFGGSQKNDLVKIWQSLFYSIIWKQISMD